MDNNKVYSNLVYMENYLIDHINNNGLPINSTMREIFYEITQCKQDIKLINKKELLLLNTKCGTMVLINIFLQWLYDEL